MSCCLLLLRALCHTRWVFGNIRVSELKDLGLGVSELFLLSEGHPLQHQLDQRGGVLQHAKSKDHPDLWDPCKGGEPKREGGRIEQRIPYFSRVFPKVPPPVRRYPPRLNRPPKKILWGSEVFLCNCAGNRIRRETLRDSYDPYLRLVQALDEIVAESKQPSLSRTGTSQEKQQGEQDNPAEVDHKPLEPLALHVLNPKAPQTLNPKPERSTRSRRGLIFLPIILADVARPRKWL